MLLSGQSCFLGKSGDRIAILQTSSEPSVAYTFEQEGVSQAFTVSSTDDLHLGFTTNVTSLFLPLRFAVATLVDNGETIMLKPPRVKPSI